MPDPDVIVSLTVATKDVDEAEDAFHVLATAASTLLKQDISCSLSLQYVPEDEEETSNGVVG